jgi:hypothetical protein
MSKRSARQSKSGDGGGLGPAPAKEESVERKVGSFLIGNAALLALGPFVGIIAGFLLLFGGIFLAMAWTTGPQPLLDSFRYAPYTAQVMGRIVESWVAVEFDPASVPEGKLYWQPESKVSPCVVVDYAGDWGAPLRRAFCGNRFQFRDDFRFDDWKTLAPGVPFAFLRDASGFAVEEIRMSKATLDWISSHPPRDTFMLSKPPPTTALGALKEQFDRPLDIAVASWSTPFPAMALAYDPKHPDQAIPAALAEQRRQGFWWGSLVFTLIIAVPGVYVWRLGINLLTGQIGAILWLLTLVPLIALPWWSELLPAVLRHANRNWAEIATDMLDDITRVTRFSASSREEALQVDGERIVWHVEKGAYADTFGRMQFKLPEPPPKTADAALAALRLQASAAVRRLDPGEQAALFVRLRRQFDAFARNVQSVFWDAAEDALRDPQTGPAVHRAAKDFLIFASGGSYYEDQLDAMEKAAARAPQPD